MKTPLTPCGGARSCFTQTALGSWEYCTAPFAFSTGRDWISTSLYCLKRPGARCVRTARRATSAAATAAAATITTTIAVIAPPLSPP